MTTTNNNHPHYHHKVCPSHCVVEGCRKSPDTCGTGIEIPVTVPLKTSILSSRDRAIHTCGAGYVAKPGLYRAPIVRCWKCGVLIRLDLPRCYWCGQAFADKTALDIHSYWCNADRYRSQTLDNSITSKAKTNPIGEKNFEKPILDLNFGLGGGGGIG